MSADQQREPLTLERRRVLERVARTIWQEPGQIEIDEGASASPDNFSEVDGGAWVRGWLWVYEPNEED